MLKTKEFLYFYRILNWRSKLSSLRPLGFLFFGYLLAHHYELKELFLNTLAGVGILLSSYSLNDYFDWKKQGEENFLSNLIQEKKLTERQAFLLGLLPLLLTGGLFLVSSTTAKILFCLVSLLAIFYSAPPLRLKERPLLGSLVSPLTMVAFFLQGFFILGSNNLNVFLLAILLFFFQLHLELLHYLEDSLIEKEIHKIAASKAIFWLKNLSLISLVFSLIFSLLNYIFLISVVFSLVRFFSFRNFQFQDSQKLRRAFSSPSLSLYEFALYALLANLGLFAG